MNASMKPDEYGWGYSSLRGTYEQRKVLTQFEEVHLQGRDIDEILNAMKPDTGRVGEPISEERALREINRRLTEVWEALGDLRVDEYRGSNVRFRSKEESENRLL